MLAFYIQLFFIYADEETTMAGAQQICKHPNLKPSRCIIGEPTDMTPVFTHKGHMTTAIRVVGRSGHSSDPERGLNAIEVMHKVITKLLILKEQIKNKYSINHFEIPYPTLNLGNIYGGDNANRICGCCEMHIDMHPLPGHFPGDGKQAGILFLDIQQRGPDFIGVGRANPSQRCYQKQQP